MPVGPVGVVHVGVGRKWCSWTHMCQMTPEFCTLVCYCTCDVCAEVVGIVFG